MNKWWSSFRVRLVIASLAWTVGLVYLVHLASVFLLFGADALERFGARMVPSTIVAIAGMVVGAIIVRSALGTFGQLRRRLLDVQAGRERSVTGHYMSEVQPVVTALNGLLEHQERRVRDAVAKAGDLAHGLKTPLAVLSHEAERAAIDGHHELAATLRQQLGRMRQHIDYHLAHARAAASGSTPGTRCSVVESADGICRTLARLHAQRGITITVEVPADLVVRVQREDLDEMLGNLVDNACKWATSRVEVTAAGHTGSVVIHVDEDGPGLAAEMREVVLQRGVRADQAAPGSGFGLAIVADLADLYRGSIALETSPMGGVRAVLALPEAGAEHSGAVQLP